MGTVASITFIKTITPTFITFNQTAYVSYQLTHTRPNEILTNALITDSLFTLPGLSILQTSGGVLTRDQITFVLPPNGLPPRQTTTVTITLSVLPDALPSSTTYATDALGAFTLSSGNLISITETSKFEINGALLSIAQDILPIPPIPFGSAFTITITITNIGNKKAMITAGQFMNYWTSTLPNPIHISSISDSRFTPTINSIINTSTINLQEQEILTLQINAHLLDLSSL